MQPASPINSTQGRPVAAATALSQAESTAVSQVVSESTAAIKFEVGQQIQATIQEQVSPGLYKVQIAGQSMQLQLPGQIKVGSQIALQVLSTSPRLSFGVTSSSAPISTAEELSSTSRLLSNLTQQAPSKTLVESASGKAVWPSADTAPETVKLAVALKDALANSGLFYESHQAQWVAGKLSTAQLLTEPQNQLVQVATNSQPAPPGTGTVPAQPEPGRAAAVKPDTPAAALQQSSTGIAETQPRGAATGAPSDMPSSPTSNASPNAISNSNSTSSAPFPIAKELIPLVQQQLHTLETHQLAWSGQVWPNQQMQWEIQGEPEHRSSHPDERQWHTEMQLDLPRLGDVKASLTFHQGAVRIALYAGNTDARTLFDRRLPELATAMKSAGIPLSSAVVEKS